MGTERVYASMESKSIFKTVVVVIGLIVAFLAMATVTPAQSHEGYMYAKVYTDRATYVGPIRWGGEEVFWTDMFNAAKKDNDYAKLIPKEKENKDWWSNYDWSFESIWQNKGNIHQFTCQFGNLKEIIVRNEDDITLKLKNGGEMRVDGEGYNDLGSKVQILDEELGTININWDRIQRIEFLNTPAKLDQVFGQPLYGTVQGGRRESYTGYIVWDNDERLSSDKLDGDTRDGDVSIKFSEISAIEKRDDGCDVTLRSGRTQFLDDSNDVDSGNRGVWVISPEFGVIKFSWKAFRKITFSPPPGTGQVYSSFPAPVPMEATVSLVDGGEMSGRIIYDVDEALDFEMIEGKENDIEYQIPIRLIARITPKNFDYSEIELKSGQRLLLGGMRDVSEDNSGILLFRAGKKDPVHIAWRKVNEIIFK